MSLLRLFVEHHTNGVIGRSSLVRPVAFDRLGAVSYASSTLDTVHEMMAIHLWCAPLVVISSCFLIRWTYCRSYFYLITNYFNPIRLLSGVWCVSVPLTVSYNGAS